MTDEEKEKQLIQDAIDRGELARLPGGYIIETSKLTDEHRAELCANSGAERQALRRLRREAELDEEVEKPRH